MSESKMFCANTRCRYPLYCITAQEYSIRANRGLNLRAAPSLTADIADTVTSGTIMQVVGKSGSWLKITPKRKRSLAGGLGQLQPRRGQRANRSSAARQRLSTTAASWIDFASAIRNGSTATGPYQNGHCAAPAQPQPVTPAQPAASAPANVDNCCFVDRQCLSDQEWVERLLGVSERSVRRAGAAASSDDRCRLAANRRQLLFCQLALPIRRGKGAGLHGFSAFSVR